MDTTHIYTLSDPRNGVVRYVGKANNLKLRLKLHLRKHENTRKSQWVFNLKKLGLEPVIEVLDIVPVTEWQFWEMYWISQMKAWGAQVVQWRQRRIRHGSATQFSQRKNCKAFQGKSK